VLPGGGSVTVLSADNPDGLRGAGLDGLFFDEGAFAAPEVWRERLRPALADKQGWAALGSTPNGRNWYWKGFNDWKRDPSWACFHRPSRDNPLLTSEELESIKREIGPRRFAQEMEALATESEGVLWPGCYFEDEVIYADPKIWPQSFEMSTLYLDPSIGRESKTGDYSAIIFAGLRNGKLWVRADIEKRPPGDMVRDFYGMWLRFNPTASGIETNGFQQVLLPLLQQYGQQHELPLLPITPVVNTENKGVRIQRLDPYLASGEIKIFRDRGGELLVEQMQMFPAKEYHDDGPDALEGAVRLMAGVQSWEIRNENESYEEYATA
jgi:predicted phage terminase large subunit-like protein